MEAELEFERHKADELTKRVRGRVAEATVSTEPRSTWDYDATLILRNKVRDLTAANDNLKTEMAKMRKVKNCVKCFYVPLLLLLAIQHFFKNNCWENCQ